MRMSVARETKAWQQSDIEGILKRLRGKTDTKDKKEGNAVKKGLLAVLVSAYIWSPAILHAQSLDTPLEGSHVSGIGYVRGWKCTGTNLTYTIDNGSPVPLSYGGQRGDTQGACGDTNNG